MRQTDIDRLARIKAALDDIAANMVVDTDEVVGKNDPLAIVDHFVKVRAAAEQMKDVREAMYKIEDVLSRERIPQCFRDNKLKSLNVEGVGRVTVSARWACSMIDSEKGMEWLRHNELGALIKETVNSSTLAATAKNRVETEGKDMPEDIFKTSINAYTSITKK